MDDHSHTFTNRRSLLPFQGDALRWLTGTATTKNINSIKNPDKPINLNPVITTRNPSTCYIYTGPNITRHAAQVNRHSINILMDVTEATSHNINNLHNLTMSLSTHISFHQLILHIRSVFASLCYSLNYIWMVSAHTMDYINAATSGTFFPHILPVMDLQKMLVTYIRYLTTYAAPTCLTRWYPKFLQIFTHSCSDWKQTIFTADWCNHSG